MISKDKFLITEIKEISNYSINLNQIENSWTSYPYIKLKYLLLKNKKPQIYFETFLRE